MLIVLPNSLAIIGKPDRNMSVQACVENKSSIINEIDIFLLLSVFMNDSHVDGACISAEITLPDQTIPSRCRKV